MKWVIFKTQCMFYRRLFKNIHCVWKKCFTGLQPRNEANREWTANNYISDIREIDYALHETISSNSTQSLSLSAGISFAGVSNLKTTQEYILTWQWGLLWSIDHWNGPWTPYISGVTKNSSVFASKLCVLAQSNSFMSRSCTAVKCTLGD